jgi:hypothetical protein
MKVTKQSLVESKISMVVTRVQWNEKDARRYVAP